MFISYPCLVNNERYCYVFMKIRNFFIIEKHSVNDSQLMNKSKNKCYKNPANFFTVYPVVAR